MFILCPCNAHSRPGPGASLGQQRALLKLLTYFCFPGQVLKWFSDFRREAGEGGGGHPDQGVLRPWGWRRLHSLWTWVQPQQQPFYSHLLPRNILHVIFHLLSRNILYIFLHIFREFFQYAFWIFVIIEVQYFQRFWGESVLGLTPSCMKTGNLLPSIPDPRARANITPGLGFKPSCSTTNVILIWEIFILQLAVYWNICHSLKY